MPAAVKPFRLSDSFHPLLASIVLVLGFAGTADATPFSLWIGNDTHSSRSVLDVTRMGAVLLSGPLTGVEVPGPFPNVTGIAVDRFTNTIYYGSVTDGTNPDSITPRSLTPPVVVTGPSFSTGFNGGEDLAFDGSSIWRANFSGNIQRINPSTHAVTVAFSTLFSPVGIAWDGANLWLSDFFGKRVVQYTTLGATTGNLFPTATNPGGLAWDTTDSTLWLGDEGVVRHYTTLGAELGSFGLPDSRFVDGLEFEGAAVPEPPSLLLLSSGLLNAALARRRRRRRPESL